MTLPTRSSERIRAVIQDRSALTIDDLARVDLAVVLMRLDPIERLTLGGKSAFVVDEMPTVENQHACHRRQFRRDPLPRKGEL